MPTMTDLALFLVFISISPFLVHSQQIPPTVANCGPLLLPLIPCAPFVQGTATTPTQSCCNSLRQLYSQQPGCLCLMLNNTSALSTFPVNTTLASQLPTFCSLQAADNTTICSGKVVPANPPASQVPPPDLQVPPPASQVPSRGHPNSTIAASPVAAMIPKTSILGYSRSEGTKLKIKSYLVVLIAAYFYM